VTHAVGGEAATLVWLANQNCITPHVWTARADKTDQPDRIVFDFDPPDDGDGHIEAIRAGALAIGDLLREIGLTPYAMTSGSRGIHVVAPLRRGPDSDTVRTRAGELAEEVAGRLPDRLTTSWRKEGRGGRVLVDAARNTYAQTAVAAYAVRAKPGAPVATPLFWDEVADAEPRGWTLRDVPARLHERGDPWEGIASAAASLRA
jgi:bifunctional non-homologous end joining protein LigD